RRSARCRAGRETDRARSAGMMHASPTTEPDGVDAAPEPSGGAGPARGSGRSAIPRRALIAAKLIVSCALIALILRGTHVGEVLNAIARADRRLVFRADEGRDGE